MFDSLSDADKTIAQKLEPWLNNPPDYYDMQSIYNQHAKAKANVRSIQREIERAEDQINQEVDKPRSNETKKKKIEATSDLKDALKDAEILLIHAEFEVKKLEFIQKMFTSAVWRMKMSFDV